MEEQSTDRYFFPSWQVTADDRAQLLNACGRTDQEGVGVALTLKDAKARQIAERLRKEYRVSVLEAMRSIVDGGVSKKQNLQYFISTNPSLSGVLAGLTMQFIGDCDKPTIALSMHGDKVRVSSRANFRLVEKGVDLAVALTVGMVLASVLFMNRMARVSTIQAISREALDEADEAEPELRRWRGSVPAG